MWRLSFQNPDADARGFRTGETLTPEGVDFNVERRPRAHFYSLDHAPMKLRKTSTEAARR